MKQYVLYILTIVTPKYRQCTSALSKTTRPSHFWWCRKEIKHRWFIKKSQNPQNLVPKSRDNELGRLTQGFKTRIKGTDTMTFVPKSTVPSNRKVTYSNFVCDYCPLKSEPFRVQLIFWYRTVPVLVLWIPERSKDAALDTEISYSRNNCRNNVQFWSIIGHYS